MNPLSKFLSGLTRAVVKLVLVGMAAIFGLSLLVAVLVAVLVTVVWSLLTGRKPAIFTTFTRFRQAAQAFKTGRASWGQRNGHAPQSAADVVDVQAHEVRPATAQIEVRPAPPADSGAPR
ncbi:hypothetical protein [Rhodoferax aquaticus]|uniref:Uncharacterized protein n=1 Tax=Rhodoferax aquaticus TaxID=2527691 RepID=A0A515EU88_9BURK|nr:hypothetical protein [Rhodoferax aquaticus]QDL56221.1 hypothetical protein EXZ61_19795 [Rhodoferax aquaticus]